jgi:ATP-binding cassette, subfamily B, bacterial HlyB/CyaB
MPEFEGFERAPRRSTSVLAIVEVGRRLGLTLDYDQLVRSTPFRGDEPPLPVLLKLAEKTGLAGRVVEVPRGGLSRLASTLPAILVLPNLKAIVLEGVQDHDGVCFALINDLEAGSATALVDEQRLYDLWDGEAVILKRRWRLNDEERPFDAAWLVGQLVRERRLFRDIGVAAFLMSVLALAPPIGVMIMLDRVLVNGSLSTLGVLAIGLVLITAFDTLFGYLRRHLVETASARIDARINLYVFDKVLNLPLSYFEHVPTGDINARIGAIWHIRQFLTGELFGTLVDSVSLVVLLPVLFLLNALMALLVVAIAVVILGIYWVFLPSLRRRYHRLVEAERSLGAHQVETIFGIKTVKSLSLEGLKRQQRDVRVADVVEAHHAFANLSTIPQTLVTPLERAIYSGSFLLGSYFALSNTSGFQAGAVIAFTMVASRVAAPIVQLAGMINSFEQARGAMSEVASVMNVPPEEGRSGDGLKAPIQGQVTFNEVRFRYSPTAPYALDGASFEIPPGTIFGVMGRSGSGKTTVTRLLQGLNRDYEGLIKIDGMNLREIDLDHLRANIGVVPQENFLFSGTVRDNIAAARPRASSADVVRVAQLAGAEEFIERLPHGYETIVEEGAVNFSGGQRQRLAIARALLVDPPILILDEATSALDAESEAIVNANLLRIARGRTMIIISHRLSSLMMADAILVLERGRAYDIGKHQDLLARCDIYRNLWRQQNRHLEQRDAHAGFRRPAVA